MEEIKTSVNLEEYFSKMTPEDAAAITTMCMDRLCQQKGYQLFLYVVYLVQQMV